MIIHKIPKVNKFTQLSNALLRDKRMSFRARGIAAYIISLPGDAVINSESLSDLGREGRDAIRSAMTELSRYGYLTLRKYQNEKGHWVTETIFNDEPDEKYARTDMEPKTDFQASVSQALSNNTNNKILKMGATKKVAPSPNSEEDDEVPFSFSKQEDKSSFAEPDPTPPVAATPPSPHVALMLAISQVMLGHSTHKLWTRDQSVLFGKTAKKFRENGINEVDLMAWYENVWKTSFFGLKGSHPTYNQMMGGVGAYVAASQTKAGKYFLGLDDYEGDAS